MKSGTTTTVTQTNMSLKKKTIQRVNKILRDPEKRLLYSEAEILYMEKQIVLLKEERARRVKQRKEERGFAPSSEEGLSGSSLCSPPRPTE